MVVGLSEVQAAVNGLNTIIGGIERLVEYRAQKRREKALRSQGQRYFIYAFSLAGAPDEDAVEEETIRSYCKKLQNIVRSHWSFIFGRGSYNAEAAHAFMANTLFHVAAMPGLPPTPSPKSAVTESLARTYQNATTKLSDLFKFLENSADYKISGLSLTIKNVDHEMKAGFAVGANLQATMDATQAIAASNYGYPLGMVPSVDTQTSQMNVADLMASQSSPEELDAAYSRIETRCAQSISRSSSPCNSHYSDYSNSSSHCPTPVSPIFSQNPFGSPVMPYEDQSKAYGFGGYGGGYASSTEVNVPGMSGGWGFETQIEPQIYNPYQPTIGRSASCRW